ncbi:MAG: GerMN domain-containing protein, partial [Rhodoglobus sp.]
IIDDQIDPEFIVLPSGPQTGATQREILEDFMRAVRGPQNDYAIARQFMTTGLAKDWDPDESATIRTGIPAVIAGLDETELDYSITSLAYVDRDGRFFQTGATNQVLDFSFAREGGEWRIAAAPNGIVLTQSSFDAVFTERALYFFDPSYRYLVPDVRWFPSRATISGKIVRALLAGPSSWLQQGVLLSAFPVSTSLGPDSVLVAPGSATVDLSSEALTATPQERDRMRQQLAASLDVSVVNMSVGSVPLATPLAGVGATLNPTVEGAVLVGTGDEFGFDPGSGISPIATLSGEVVAAGATAATLGTNQQSVVLLAAEGMLYVDSGSPARLIDGRPGQATPTMDPFRYLWSVRAADATSLVAFETDGTPHPVQTGLWAEGTVASIDISRDGTRMLLYLQTSLGPRLYVAGIIRQQDNTPISLGTPLELPVAAGAPIDSTWVDDRRVAGVSSSGPGSLVTLYEVGGPSAALGVVEGAVAIAGGNGGADGLRVLRSTGEVWRLQGSSWVVTGVVATFLGTKQ